MSNFTLYPRLTDKLMDLLNYDYNTNFDFFFTNDHGDLQSIRLDNVNDNTIILKDVNNRWLHNINNLIIKKKINFKTKGLFGPKGIAPNNSKIGVSIAWFSQKSITRGVIKQFEFDSSTSTINKSIEVEFQKGQFRGDATIQVMIYLKEQADFLTNNERHLNNTPGVVLGVLEEKTLVFDGSGSKFPTEEFEDKNAPLWRLKIMNDLSGDITENISLQINKSHKKYYLFDMNSDKYSPDFLEEVMISVVSMIIQKFKDDLNEIKNTDYHETSLGSLINYYINTYNIDIEDITTIQSSVNKVVRK